MPYPHLARELQMIARVIALIAVSGLSGNIYGSDTLR